MKSVLVGGTTIEFKIDKELINDKTPNKKDFYFKNGIEDYFKLEYSNKNRLDKSPRNINEELVNKIKSLS